MLNLKAYPSAVGPGALRLAEGLATKTAELGVAAAVAPAAADIGRLAESLWIPVLAQHADAFGPGAKTGYLVPSALRAAGAAGSLVNHSEHRLPGANVGPTLDSLRGAGLVPLLCSRDAKESARLARFRPPYLAVEPPELIGGKISVAEAKPEVIEDTVAAVHRVSPSTIVLCGAGIHDRNDVRRSLELGAEGILVASAVAASARPRAAMDELLAGF
ncbi:MAG TPA: triose-phosphate isomerase [Thermoplasmata archaeon]|nr:triose-phosphate isomerase [Thermoplasmata archaeon]